MNHGDFEAARHSIARSPEWHKVEKEHLEIEPVCQCCGTKNHLQVHHIWPFHIVVALGFPELELSHKNLITICEDPKTQHHLLLGHLDDYKSANPEVRAYCAKYKNMTKEQIHYDADWQQAHFNRLAPLDKLTDEEKQHIKDILSRL